MRVVRLLIYEGEPEEMARQLGRSLPDGVRGARSRMLITVLTLGTIPTGITLGFKDSSPSLLEEARRLCQRFVDKVESGSAHSIETYEDCKSFLRHYDDRFMLTDKEPS